MTDRSAEYVMAFLEGIATVTMFGAAAFVAVFVI